jgi:hypothetical protein
MYEYQLLLSPTTVKSYGAPAPAVPLSPFSAYDTTLAQFTAAFSVGVLAV